ncbi:MAG: glycosyltransferase [Patescibacteria group bacterium]|jgi:glycosyltransferase involved in cell wall biosynthesis
MEKINIIMFSMSHYTDWQKGRVNRNYHILNQLQKDERVDKIISVDFLPFSWKKAAKIYWENVIRPMKNLELIYGDLTSSCHQVNSKLYIYSTIDSIYSQKIVLSELRRIIKVLNLSNIVFWSYNPLFTSLLTDLGRKQVDRRAFVFDAVDNWLEHPAFKKFQPDLKVGYQIIRQDADLIFTVSDYLKTNLFPDKQKCYWIPNGIEMEHFTGPKSKLPRPKELAGIKEPIIGYHGVIESRVDLDLIKYVAEHNRDKAVVLIGAGIWKKQGKILAEKFAGEPNVHLIPFVPYQDLPQYLQAFSVGIIPHKINNFTKSMNPMKLYEYLASGKPVVATSLEGAESFHNLVYLAETPTEFNAKIQLALREDSPELRQTRIEVVADDSWYGRMQLMMNYLMKVLE